MTRYGLAVLAGLVALVPVGAKESPPPPTLEEMAAKSQIVVAEYVGYVAASQKGPDWYKNGVTATYKLEKVLLGDQLPEKFTIRYDFHDGFFCLGNDPGSPINQPFDDKCMPAKGSRWVLFLRTDDRTTPVRTFRGTCGRLEATPENLEKVKKLLPADR